MKKIAFSFILFFAFSFAKAQVDFSHAIGLNMSSISDGYSGLTATTGTYIPRINFGISDNASVSVVSPISLGFAADSRYGSSLWLDLPLSAEFNLGRLATTDNDGGFGMFFGGGMAFTSVSLDGFGGSFLNVNGYLGSRFSLYERPLEVRLNYGKGLGDWSPVSKLGISLSYTLGFE